MLVLLAWLLLVPQESESPCGQTGWPDLATPTSFAEAGSSRVTPVPGKTTSGIRKTCAPGLPERTPLGGLCIDEKVSIGNPFGNGTAYTDEHDLIHLQIREDDESTTSLPAQLRSVTASQHSLYHLCQIRRGHRHKSRPGR